MKSKKKLLIIEDDPATIDLYNTAFKNAGFKVNIFDTGKSALEGIKKLKEKETNFPDLILLDIILPDMNGIKILEELKKRKETKKIPVFIVTNYSDKDLEKLSKVLKSEKYLLKTDFVPSKIIEIIKSRLEN